MLVLSVALCLASTQQTIVNAGPGRSGPEAVELVQIGDFSGAEERDRLKRRIFDETSTREQRTEALREWQKLNKSQLVAKKSRDIAAFLELASRDKLDEESLSVQPSPCGHSAVLVGAPESVARARAALPMLASPRRDVTVEALHYRLSSEVLEGLVQGPFASTLPPKSVEALRRALEDEGIDVTSRSTSNGPEGARGVLDTPEELAYHDSYVVRSFRGGGIVDPWFDAIDSGPSLSTITAPDGDRTRIRVEYRANFVEDRPDQIRTRLRTGEEPRRVQAPVKRTRIVNGTFSFEENLTIAIPIVHPAPDPATDELDATLVLLTVKAVDRPK